MKIFGVSEIAVRLPSFVAMVILLALVYRAADIYFGRRTAQLGCLILSTMLLPLVSAGAVLTDPFLALGVTLSMLAFHISAVHPTRFWRYGFFIGIVIGLLSKGPLVLVLIGMAIVPWLIFQNDWRSRISVFPWFSGSLIVLALSLPWYMASEIKTPGFLQYFIVGEHFLRFVDSGWSGDLYGTAHERPLGSIWIEFILASMPWGLVGLVAFLYFLITSRKKEISSFFREGNTTYLTAWALAAPGLSVISCLRHNMTPRSVYATQTKNPSDHAADHCPRTAGVVR
ncbi:ArnT family glycosyltransferase [Parapusillimonas sp. JC17]|uniref:ArnT family glycosyltransferase n=1 Tax=Parapusillimonas sp. JC17 TaxID=3445768 RepID=UPI003F9F2F2A